MANPKILGIITFILLLASAFVAMKNKAAYEREIEAAATEQNNLKISTDRLKAAQDEANAKSSEIAEAKETIAKLTEDEVNQKKTNIDFKSELEAKTGQVENLQGDTATLQANLERLTEAKGMINKFNTLKKDIEELKTNIAQSETSYEEQTTESRRIEEKLKAINDHFQFLSSGDSNPTLKTVIRSIYPTWGFVTLAAGDTDGVVLNSTLNVVRGETTVAKLVVTAVELNTASANIIPASIRDDVTLMIGDEVVAAKSTAAN